MSTRLIADKYIAHDGSPPLGDKVVWIPTKVSDKERDWLTKAILRGGYMPIRERDGDSAPFLSELRSMHRRGLIQGLPWRISKFGRDLLAELERASRPLDSVEVQPPPPATIKSIAAQPAIRLLADIEREAICAAVAHFKGNKSRAAKALGIAVRTIRNKLHEYEAAQEGANLVRVA